MKTRAAKSREKTSLRAGHSEESKPETGHEKPLGSRVTSGPRTLDCPVGRIGPHFNLYPLLCFI